MKKIVLAAAALALSAGAAFAENPNFGIPADLYANDHTPSAHSRVDYTPTASIQQRKAPETTVNATNPAAHRFGDASPANGE
ncbi:hypothetical protein ATN84_03310 [Paramesorhizobium deserti]|uniref:DUF680 domain-containing protein n=1 Tax=Paramesorhizobium deserti TaxID=1494590 RepID=A0A135I035_9HYPH|nr:hypothetical protein [Paramesorhizobium deserti]KXF78807.1 hypothetical protein ATN84_03310 [Paramesorhizobium deserti]